VSGSQRAALDALQRRSDQTVTTAVSDTFRPAFLIAAAFALAAALVLLPVGRDRAVIAAVGVAIAVPAATSVVALAVRPTPVAILNPCHHRRLPGSGGVAGTLQDVVLRGLDSVACQFGSSREELVLALADPRDARRYQAEHGVNPRALSSVLGAVLKQSPGLGSLGSALGSLIP
jgi:hypothetical protein